MTTTARYDEGRRVLTFDLDREKSVSIHPGDLVLATVRQTYFFPYDRAYQLRDVESDFLGYTPNKEYDVRGNLVLAHFVELGPVTGMCGPSVHHFKTIGNPQHPLTIKRAHFDRIVNLVEGKNAIVELLVRPDPCPNRADHIGFVRQMLDSLRRQAK